MSASVVPRPLTARWLALHPSIRIAITVAALVVAVAPSIILLVYHDITDTLTGFGYASVFLANLVSTATLFIPVPGLTAAANLLIVEEGGRSAYPWLIGIAGGTGMAIGEITAYYAGVVGSEVARVQEMSVPSRLQPYTQRAIALIERLMQRWGMLTLFVLAAIPDPVFEIAGVTAGSVRMPFRRYFLAVLAGSMVRALSLAYLGEALPFL